MFIVTPSSVSNPAALGRGRVDRPLLGRGMPALPRGLFAARSFWRIMLELPMVRYSIVLLPFPVAMLIWPELALPISGAPLLMFLLILYVEGNVLSVPTAQKRRALIDRAEAERGLDLFAARGRATLTRIAAGRGMAEGVLVLVVEQSAMARFPPLTYVALRDGAEGRTLDLTEAERAMVADLFASDLDEALLHRINLSENVFLRSVTLDAASLSAHARLAAMARARG